MSSFLQMLHRKAARKSPDYEGQAQPTVMHADGVGYDTLTPTKGWRSYSMKRLWAGQQMAKLLDHPPRLQLPRIHMTDRPNKVEEEKELARPPSRQQRRATERRDAKAAKSLARSEAILNRRKSIASASSVDACTKGAAL